MTVAPRRRTRATNVNAEPLIPVYETEARKFIRANLAKNAAAKIEKNAKLECHKSMLAFGIGTFEVNEDGKDYVAEIAGGEKDSVNIERLHKKVLDGEITMKQFLSCISASQTAVQKECGTNVLAGVLDTTATEAALSIKEKK